MEFYRLILFVWGPKEPHSDFLKQLALKGWDFSPPETTLPAQTLYPGFRILTHAGVTNVGPVVKMVPPHITIKDQHGNRLTEIPAIPNFGCSNVEEQFMDLLEYHPEEVAPSAADSLAVIIAEVEASP